MWHDQQSYIFIMFVVFPSIVENKSIGKTREIAAMTKIIESFKQTAEIVIVGISLPSEKTNDVLFMICAVKFAFSWSLI